MAAPFILSPLPWNEDALEPVISAQTIAIHYHKHHKSYVDALNRLVTGTEFAHMTVEEIARSTAAFPEGRGGLLGNNAGQIWNHDFYWRSLTPKSTMPSGALSIAIERDFGDLEALTTALLDIGISQFGAGWAWLISSGGILSVMHTSNAHSPMARGINCLLAIDVWEHAYYLDYQNLRGSYLASVLSKVISWDFASANLAKEARPVRSAVE